MLRRSSSSSNNNNSSRNSRSSNRKLAGMTSLPPSLPSPLLPLPSPSSTNTNTTAEAVVPALLPDVEFIRYRIHDFANRRETQGEYVETKGVVAHGYPWKLRVFPSGRRRFVSLFVRYAGDDDEYHTKTTNHREGGGGGGGVIARANFVCKTHKKCGEVRTYTKNDDWGFEEFLRHDQILEQHDGYGFLDDDGALTVDVELRVTAKGPWRSSNPGGRPTLLTITPLCRRTRDGTVWYPKESSSILSTTNKNNTMTWSKSRRGSHYDKDDNLATRMFVSGMEFSDVTFRVQGGMEFKAHKCVLAVKCRPLLDFVLDSEELGGVCGDRNNNKEDDDVGDDLEEDDNDSTTVTNGHRYPGGGSIVEVNNVSPKVFRALLENIYGVVQQQPGVKKGEGERNDHINFDDENDNNETYANELLVAGNRFGYGPLKLHAESMLVDLHLTIENASLYLPMADSHSCALLKEASMDYISSNPQIAMESPYWYMVEESSRLMTELLLHFGNQKEDYYVQEDDVLKSSSSSSSNMPASSFSSMTSTNIKNNNKDYDDTLDRLDVTSLRRRLESENLSCDGSREMLIGRLREEYDKNREEEK